MKKRIIKNSYFILIFIIIVTLSISLLLSSKPLYKSPIPTQLYPVLIYPFTQYSSEIYLINLQQETSTPILRGIEVIEGNEATDYFYKETAENRGYGVRVSLYISPKDENNFIEIALLSLRNANNLFSYNVDFSEFQNGEYILRIEMEDLNNGLRGTLDEPIIIDNTEDNLLLSNNEENLIFKELQQAQGCKCKNAKMISSTTEGALYHNRENVPGAQPGPFSTNIPIRDPATGTVSPGVAVGIGFSTQFSVEGRPELCKEKQGIRSTELVGSTPTTTITNHLQSSSPPPGGIIYSPNGAYGYSAATYSNMKDFANDNYERLGSHKSYRENNPKIVMTDTPSTAIQFSSVPGGYTRLDEFLSEVEDSEAGADGIKRKCRCNLRGETYIGALPAGGGAPSSGGRVYDKRCVSGVPVTCGNKKIDDGEECDDGNIDERDTCGMDCKKTSCGDGFRQQPNGQGDIEQCEKGVACERDDLVCIEDTCSCQRNLYCGDNRVTIGEECDPPKSSCVIRGDFNSVIDPNGICNGICECVSRTTRE